MQTYRLKATKKMQPKKIAKKSIEVIITIIVLLGAATMIFPFFWMFSTSLKSSSEALALVPTFWSANPNWKIYQEIFIEHDFLSAVKNTLIIEFSVIVVGSFVASLAAFSFAKLRMPHKKTILLIILSSMMVPYAALLLPQYRAYQALGLIETLWPLILPGFFGNVSMMFFLITYFSSMPSELLEAAQIDGAGYFRIYAQIYMPNAKPALAAQVIFWFVGIWNDFFAPSIYLTNPNKVTLQVLISSINDTVGAGVKIPVVMAASVISSIPMIIIYLLFQKFFVQSVAVSGITG